MENNFKIGDRVIMTSDLYCAKKGMTGTIKRICDVNAGIDILVEFDEPFFGGHTGGGCCKERQGQFIDSNDLKLIKSKDPQSTPKFKVGDTIVARDDRDDDYKFTRESNNWKGKVIAINEESNTINVVTVSATDESLQGACFFCIDPDHFKHSKSALRKEQKGKNAMSRIIIEYTPDETKIKRIEGKKITGETSIKRYKGDKDDEYTAIGYAVDKLYGRLDKSAPDKPKGFTGKAVCIRDYWDILTMGKIYNFTNGRTISDIGELFPSSHIIHDPENGCPLKNIKGEELFIDLTGE